VFADEAFDIVHIRQMLYSVGDHRDEAYLDL
jgi:hypothetical protein